MAKATLTVYAHETGMTQSKAERSENYYFLAFLSC